MKRVVKNFEIKLFEEVEVGEPAYFCSDDIFMGLVLAKGKFSELVKNYETVCSIEDIKEAIEAGYIDEFIAVSQNPEDTIEGFENLIMMYDQDPSSCFCIKPSN
jgi:hypothetical protein